MACGEQIEGLARARVFGASAVACLPRVHAEWACTYTWVDALEHGEIFGTRPRCSPAKVSEVINRNTIGGIAHLLQ